MLAQSWMARQSWKNSMFTISQFWALLSHALTKDSFEDIFETWATNLLQAFSNLLGRPEVRLYWFLAVPLCCMLGALFHGNRHVHCSCLWRGRPRKGDVELLIGCFQVIAWMNGDAVPKFWPMTYWKMNTKSFVRFRTLPSTHPAASKIFKFILPQSYDYQTTNLNSHGFSTSMVLTNFYDAKFKPENQAVAPSESCA